MSFPLHTACGCCHAYWLAWNAATQLFITSKDIHSGALYGNSFPTPVLEISHKQTGLGQDRPDVPLSKGAVGLAHLILQSSHCFLQMKLKPLIWFRQSLSTGFFIQFFSLPCLKHEKQKLINFKGKYNLQSTREPWCKWPVSWFPRWSPPTATSGGLLSITRADRQVQREARTSLVKGHSQPFSFAEYLVDLTVTKHYPSRGLRE